MSLSALKKRFEIILLWARQHWRWLIFIFAFVVVYLLGRKNSRVELIQAKLALKQYEKERRAIQKAYDTEMKLREEAKSKYDNAMKAVREEYMNDFNSLNMQKEAEIRKKLKQAKNNPLEIDKILENELGIRNNG